MSREDPQFKLRMPAELRLQAEQAARAAGRSLNAELVARLEGSFISDAAPAKLLPASKARELALMARSGISNEIQRRAADAIAKAVRLGHNSALTSLDDLQLDVGIPDEELEVILEGVTRVLSQAGYQVDWSDISSLWIGF